MPFDTDIQHWPTISAFTAYLQGVPRPSWCKGITNHNTYQPDERDWGGMASMNAMLRFYRDTKGWTSGPNLYLCAKAPNPKDTGIWQLTPITHSGTHAGACNSTHLGIENVGDFDRAPPSADQYTLLITVNLLIMQHWGLPPESINVHNECMSGRTCPGKYLTGTQIRADLGRPQPSDLFAKWGTIGKPSGAATGFAVPRAWLVNQVLGACVVPETYSASGKYSVTEFEGGIITYFRARNVALIERF